MELMQGLCHEDSQLQLRCCRLPTLSFSCFDNARGCCFADMSSTTVAVPVRGSFFESKMPLAWHSRAKQGVYAGAPAMHWSQR